jgi:hypothetical protein
VHAAVRDGSAAPRAARAAGATHQQRACAPGGGRQRRRAAPAARPDNFSYVLLPKTPKPHKLIL